MRIKRRYWISRCNCQRYLRNGMPKDVYINIAGMLRKLIGYDPVADELILK